MVASLGKGELQETQKTLAGKIGRSGFEARLKQTFTESFGQNKGVGGLPIVASKGTFSSQQIGVLQNAVDSLITEMQENGEITQDEAKELSLEYRVEDLAVESEKTLPQFLIDVN